MRPNPRRLGIVLLWSVALVVTAGCQGQGGADAPVNRVTMGPTTGQYSRVIIDPVAVTFDPTSKDIDADAKEVEMLRTHMRDALVKAVGEKDGYPIVQRPGKGVLRVRTTLTNVKKGEPLMNLHWSTKLLGLGVGEAAMQSTMVDSLTGRQVGSAFVSNKGNFFQLTEGLSKWGHAKAVMDEWARELRKELDKAHGKS